MRFKLIKEMKEVAPFLLKDRIVKPYFFKEAEESSLRDSLYKSYILVLKYKDHMLLDERDTPPPTFLQQFLERYLPEAVIGNIKIIHISEHPRREAHSEIFSLVLQPYTNFTDSKYRNRNLWNRFSKALERWLQIIHGKRESQLYNESLYVKTKARIGNWQLSFKTIDSLSKEDLKFLLSEINKSEWGRLRIRKIKHAKA